LRSLAIIVPFYNEEKRIRDGEYFLSMSREIEANFFFVDDGSSDGTISKLHHLSQVTGCQVIQLTNNSGKGRAIRAGYRAALADDEYSYIGFLDADGAFPVAEVVRSTNLALSIIEQKPEIEIFIAARIKLAGKEINRSSFRHYLSRLIITFIGLKTKNMPYDSQSGLKVFRVSKNLKDSLEEPFKTRWFFDLELMTRLGMQEKECVWEEPVNAWADIRGSKIRLRTVLSIAREMITVRKILSRR